jgi:hypothetical protein
MIEVRFNLSELTMDEMVGLRGMLDAYHNAAIGGQIKRGEFTDVKPNARERKRKLDDLDAYVAQIAQLDPVAATSADLDLADHLGVECPLLAGIPEEPQTGRPEPQETPKEVQATDAPAKRTRRTKAEMEAAKQAEAEAPAATVAAGPVSVPPVSSDEETFTNLLTVYEATLHALGRPVAFIESAVAEYRAGGVAKLQTLRNAVGSLPKPDLATPKATMKPVTEDVEPPTLDRLRECLNIFVANHSLDEGMTLLVDYECKRVSQMMARPLADQIEFCQIATAPVKSNG